MWSRQQASDEAGAVEGVVGGQGQGATGRGETHDATERQLGDQEVG